MRPEGTSRTTRREVLCLDDLSYVGYFTRTVKLVMQVKEREPAALLAIRSVLRESLPGFTLREERDRDPVIDLSLTVRKGRAVRRLLVEYKSVGEPRYLAQAITQLARASRKVPHTYLVVAAPYIGPEGRRLAREAGVGYVDLAGNAFLAFDGVYVDRQSATRPRRAKARLRRLFAPRSSRIVRVLLEGRERDWTLARLAAEAGVSLRTAHLVVGALDEKAFVERRRGAIRLAKPGELLDLWAEDYRLDAHRRHDFYTFVRQPNDAARRLAETAARLDIQVALTLHSGAALVAPFVRSAETHAYVATATNRLAESLDLRPVDTGANVHLLVPNDAGVFYGSRTVGEVPVVCDTQLYLDLLHYPARGREQADELRRRVLRF